jgi:GNAT superfamily N-acetyltransferase
MHEIVIGTIENDRELRETAALISRIIDGTPYYNDLARMEEKKTCSYDSLEVLLHKDIYSLLVAKSGSVITGFCLNETDHNLVWLSWLGVSENWRGKGIAHRLVQKLVETAPQRNISKIWCDCRTENAGSLKVFFKNDFQILCTLREHWYLQDYYLLEKFVNVKG